MVAVGVGEAGGFEPGEGHCFAIARGGEEAVDELLVGVGPCIGEEGLNFFGGGWKAGEIERDAAYELVLGGFWGRRKVVAFELGGDEMIDGVFGPVVGRRFGKGRFYRFYEGPVSFPFAPS